MVRQGTKSRRCARLTLGLSLCVSVQYLWNLTMLGCSSCVKFSKTVWIFSSCALKFLRSLNCTSFHTTSTPSSVSIARWAQSMPGTSRCSTWNREEKLLFKATWDDRVNLIGVAQRAIICRKSFNGYFYPTRAFHSALYAFADVWEHNAISLSTPDNEISFAHVSLRRQQRHTRQPTRPPRSLILSVSVATDLRRQLHSLSAWWRINYRQRTQRLHAIKSLPQRSPRYFYIFQRRGLTMTT